MTGNAQAGAQNYIYPSSLLRRRRGWCLLHLIGGCGLRYLVQSVIGWLIGHHGSAAFVCMRH